MAKAKKKLLPKDFEAMLEGGDLAALERVFDDRELDARGGYAKQTALAFYACPDELARWLVAKGASLSATDTWRNTPLHTRAQRGHIEVLLELGADVHAEATIGTPLHAAAEGKRARNAALLLEHGAKVDARNSEGLTPLELSLRGCSNIELERMVALGRVLLEAGAEKTPATSRFVAEIGKRFEFHRDAFAKDSVAAAGAALEALYELFGVAKVARRVTHDGRSPIVVKATRWQDQHAELWDLLVPSSGPAATVQGEVIRIAGRIARELDDNGGANWDDAFRAMATAFGEHVAGGVALPTPDLQAARAIVQDLVRRARGDTSRMAALAVAWVLAHPPPIALATPGYRR